jgi:hypothetical protein
VKEYSLILSLTNTLMTIRFPALSTAQYSTQKDQ